MEFLFLIVGIIVGGGSVWFVMKAQIDSSTSQSQGVDETTFQQINTDKIRFEERSMLLNKELDGSKNIIQVLQLENVDLNKRLEKAITHFKNQEDRIKEQKEELIHLNEKLQRDFENIASKVLRQNSDEISKINSERLTSTLKPLGERIKSFEDKIDQNGKDQEGLKKEILLLHELNKSMADEAQNLTKALKGDTKKQGNWGEVILERILERSGLVKGQEYDTQYSTTNVEGNRVQPDVIIKLPENKHIIIDSKVSLVAYERLINAETEEERDRSIKDHLLSVRAHIKGLSDKTYQTANGLDTPDFVLLFIPIESSFSVAVQADVELFNFAWDNKIVIVSPSTLLATLRTISSIWKQERQTQNAIEIATESGKMYDKFVDFTKDLENIGTRIEQTSKAYAAAKNKLSDGNGNLVRRAEQLRKMGAKTQKIMSNDLLEKSEDDILSKENEQNDNE